MKIQIEGEISESEFRKIKIRFDSVQYVEVPGNEDREVSYKEVDIFIYTAFEINKIIDVCVRELGYTLSYNKEKDKYILTK